MRMGHYLTTIMQYRLKMMKSFKYRPNCTASHWEEGLGSSPVENHLLQPGWRQYCLHELALKGHICAPRSCWRVQQHLWLCCLPLERLLYSPISSDSNLGGQLQQYLRRVEHFCSLKMWNLVHMRNKILPQNSIIKITKLVKRQGLEKLKIKFAWPNNYSYIISYYFRNYYNYFS